MNIAIVGEGPIGAIVCLFFIYYKLNYNINELNIFFYKSRNTFKRRHIVKISRDTLQEIEKLINLCVDCLTKNNREPIIDLSIRCLEFLLHENINNKYVNIIESKFTENDNNQNIYQNIFLCDGFASNNRLFYIYNNVKYTPLRMVIKTPLLILYGNLDLPNTTLDSTCINKSVIKKLFSNKVLLEYEIIMNELVALISIVYNINFNYNQFNEIYSDSNMREINLWVEGYTDFQNFLDIFNNTISYLNNIDEAVILTIFHNSNVFISPEIYTILKNKTIIKDIFEKYKNFLSQELMKINGLNNPFIIHNVMPNCTTFGIILDDSLDTLVFARKNTAYTSWLIGDSANSYPPGVSLQNGIKDIFILIPNFIKTNFLPDLVIPFTEDYLFDCEESTYVYNKRQVCKTLSESFFSGGYLFDDIKNKDDNTIKTLIQIIQEKKCSDDDLVNMYNNYQLNNFFYNLINYICNNKMLMNETKKGGKRKTIHKKYKIKTKIKTRKRKF
jgi:hypothetical protein